MRVDNDIVKKGAKWGGNAEVCGNGYFGLCKLLLYKELRDGFWRRS